MTIDAETDHPQRRKRSWSPSEKVEVMATATEDVKVMTTATEKDKVIATF